MKQKGEILAERIVKGRASNSSIVRQNLYPYQYIISVVNENVAGGDFAMLIGFYSAGR